MEFTCRQILNMHIFGIIVRREAGFIRFQHELCAAQFSQLPNYHSFYMMISPFQDLSKFSREPRSPSRGSEAPWIYDPGIWGDMHCILTWIVFSIFYSASSLKSSIKLSLIFNVRFLVALGCQRIRETSDMFALTVVLEGPMVKGWGVRISGLMRKAANMGNYGAFTYSKVHNNLWKIAGGNGQFSILAWTYFKSDKAW